MLRLYNSLTRKKEVLETLEPQVVRMYVCGVTVYSDAHVGHAMSALVFDILRRYLEYRGYKVLHVMNYTDVDDKIINRANQTGEDPFMLAQRYIDDYTRNLHDLNILPATSNPRATQTMPEIQSMVKGLIEKGFAYPASNGDVYFRVSRASNYGKLSGRSLDEMQAGSRIEVGEQKENPMDFALWKAAKPGEPSWDSPWGKGRPGWHIECSAMNLKELGEQIDIHGGGNDLIFPHHENEIAQTESFTGKPFSRFWIHNGMLTLGSEKMSKSVGNIISIKDFLFNRAADTMRMLVLAGSYRAPLIFNEETLSSAENSLERIKVGMRPAPVSSKGIPSGAAAELISQAEAVRASFIKAMDDDLNTPLALAAIYELVKSINTSRDEDATTEQLQPAQSILRELTGILGLRLDEKQKTGDAAKFIDLLVEMRTEARRQKLWAFSDMIRDRLLALGVSIEDARDGSVWRWG